MGKPPKSSHLFIGFSIIFTIHFGVPLFLETPIHLHCLIPPNWIFQGSLYLFVGFGRLYFGPGGINAHLKLNSKRYRNPKGQANRLPVPCKTAAVTLPETNVALENGWLEY